MLRKTDRSILLSIAVLTLTTFGGADRQSSETFAQDATADVTDDGQANESESTSPVPEILSDESNWRLFRADSFASGVATSQLPNDLEVLWRFEVPDGAFEATPVIVNGTVYLGDMDGELYAIDLATGKQVWKYETESGFIAAPAYQEVDHTSARSPEADSIPQVSDRPTTDGEVSGRVLVGDYDGTLHCVDAKTGTGLWTYASEAEISGSVNFYRGNILFGSQDTTLYCLKPFDGTLIWKHSLQDQIRCSPTLVEGRCFVAGCDQQLHIIDVKTGNAISSVPINAPTGVTPAVRGDLVFFGTEAGEVFAIDWRKAKIEWTFGDRRSSQPIRSCPAVVDDLVVIGGRSKKVYALDAKNGNLKWMFPTRNRVDSSPVIVGNRVFVGSGDGRLYALKLSTGEKIWDYETGSGFIGSPAVAEHRLVIANVGGVVYCFGKKG